MTLAANQRIVSGTALECIVAIVAVEGIVARSTLEGIISREEDLNQRGVAIFLDI